MNLATAAGRAIAVIKGNMYRVVIVAIGRCLVLFKFDNVRVVGGGAGGNPSACLP